MSEEKEAKMDVEQEQGEYYYDEIRADIDTAIYAYSTLEEIDTAMMDKKVQQQILRAKDDCVLIICRGIRELRVAWE